MLYYNYIGDEVRQNRLSGLMTSILSRSFFNYMFSLAIIISLTFSFLASLMVYMITYIEYEKHKFPPKRLRKECLNAAVFAFFAWLVISLVAFYFIYIMITQNQP